MGFFYKHIIHPFLSRGIGRKAISNNPYLCLVIDASEEDVIADELFRISLAYQHGYDMLPQDNNKAMEYCLKTANRGHAVAQLFAAQWLMRFHDDNNKEVMDWLIKAAEQGEKQAMYNLGISYHRGDIDGSVDNRKSYELFRAAAERDYPPAFTRMAQIYHNGEYVDKSDTIAKYWAWLEFTNMQEDESAFESWALVLKYYSKDKIETVIIDWEDIPAKEKDGTYHYNRFVYRLAKFSQSYDWVELAKPLPQMPTSRCLGTWPLCRTAFMPGEGPTKRVPVCAVSPSPTQSQGSTRSCLGMAAASSRTCSR